MEESLEGLRDAALMMKTVGAHFMWILFNKQDLLPTEKGQAITADHRRLFETELSAHTPNLQWQFVDLPGFSAMTGDRCSELLDIIFDSTANGTRLNAGAPSATSSQQPTKPDDKPTEAELLARIEREREGDITGDEFWNSFLSGEIVDWNHRCHLRAGFSLLLDALRNGKSILSCAEDFLEHLQRLKSTDPERFRNTEHRTMTVFWLYNLQLAIMSYQSNKSMDKWPDRDAFDDALLHSPELMYGGLWKHWYTKDLMMSLEAKMYWRLPDLQTLPNIIVRTGERQQHNGDLGGEEPDRLMSFAFSVVQLHTSSNVRRGWLVEQSLAILQTTTMRRRAQDTSLQPYSETQAYFWIQIVHAALSAYKERLQHDDTAIDALSRLSFSRFRRLFDLDTNLWRDHYTPTRWESVNARGSFVLPDLKPLPNVLTLNASKDVTSALEWESNSNDVSMSAEIPSMEVLAIHAIILLEKSASMSRQDLESPVILSHAHLLRFLFERLKMTEGHTAETLASRAKNAMLEIQGPFMHGLTLKAFWTQQVLAAIGTSSEIENFDDLIRANMHLAYTDLTFTYFSPVLLRSLDAEEKIVAPDRKRLNGFAYMIDLQNEDEEWVVM
jgi:ubiquitin carboxyl-terminal hydrolase L3